MTEHLPEEPKDLCKITLKVGQMREEWEERGRSWPLLSPHPLVFEVGKLSPQARSSQIHPDARFCRMAFTFLNDIFNMKTRTAFHDT